VDGVLKPIGLLIEEARTNLITYSEQFDNADWEKRDVSVTADSITAPDGTTTGDTLIENGLNDVRFIRNDPGLSGENQLSIFLKSKGDDRYLQIRPGAIGSGVAYATFDPDAGTVSGSGGTGFISANIEVAGDGWYHCAMTMTDAGPYEVDYGLVDSPTASELEDYLGDGTSGVYVWGAEAKDRPSSYIPTAGAQVTRAADNCVRTLGDEFNPEEGTLYAEAQYLNSNTTAGGTYGLTDGTSSQRMLVAFEPSETPGGSSDFITAFITDANSVTAAIPSSVNAVASGFHKVAISYNSTSFTFAVDGVIVGTASHEGVPTVDRIDGQGGSIGDNGTLTKELRLFPTALSDAELITLTGGT
jgi:hypothetical protein